MAKDPNAPLPTFAEAPAATLAPGVCPKCNGQTSDVGGRLVCGQCYWVVDQGKAPLMPQRTAMTQTAAAPAGFSMMHLGIIVTVFFLVLLVFMVQSLNKMPPPNMNSQQMPFGMHAPGTATAPASPRPAVVSPTPQPSPATTAPASPVPGAPVTSSPVPTTSQPAVPQGYPQQQPQPVGQQGGLTSPQSAQPALPPTIVPQGGVGVGTK